MAGSPKVAACTTIQATIDFSQLVYDVANRRSNYAELRAAALSAVAAAPAVQDAATTADGADPDAATDAALDADAAVDDAAVADAAESGTAPDAATAASSGFWLTEFAGLANIGSGPASASSGYTPALLSAYLQACMPGTPPNPCDGGAGDAGDDGAVEAGSVTHANKQPDLSVYAN